MRELLQGFGLGVAIVLPGLSGGTAALIMGIYRQLVDDISRFRFGPHLALGGGVVAGLLGGARAVAWLLETAPDLLSSFLLGVLLVTAWVAFRAFRRPGPAGLLAWVIGVTLALAVATQPLGRQAVGGGINGPQALVGGAAASAAMMLPGFSGGTLLILLGFYDDMLGAVNQFNWYILALFSVGGLAGILGISRLVSRLLALYPIPLGLFLAGLVLGSTRAVIPGRFGVAEGFALALGVMMTWTATRGRREVL